jgi:hypothetical protein
MMHLILAGNSTRGGLAVHLRQRQEAVAAHFSALDQAVEELGEQAGLGELVAIEYGLSIASAELVWLEDKLGQLSTEAETDSSKEDT